MAALSVTAANVAASTQATIRREYLRASAGQTAGQAVYLNTSQKWALLDSDATPVTTADEGLVGILLDAGGIDQPASVCVKDPDFTPGATLTNGLVVYNFTTAGAISQADIPTTGAYPVALGIAKSTTKMNLNPTISGAII